MPRIALSTIACLALLACASTEPAGYVVDGRDPRISGNDIRVAIAAAQERCVAEHFAPMPVFRVQITGPNEMWIYCGPHYMRAVAVGGMTIVVKRTDGRWHVTSFTPEKANSEHVIIT